MSIDTADNEEIYLRQFIAHHMSFKASEFWNDIYMKKLYEGYENNMRWVLMDNERFGRTEKELQEILDRVDQIVIDEIKNGRPASQPCPSPSYSNATKL